MSYTVLLVGLGQIGMSYDYLNADGNNILTHARAFHLNNSFTLVGAVDLDARKCESFAEQYGVYSTQNLCQALKKCSPDVVVIATPTNTHGEVVASVLRNHAPRVILCEKPLSYSKIEAADIVEKCKESGCELFVNYIRRSDPGAIEVKRRINCGELELPAKGVVFYSKGLFNNCSHFIDLLSFWLGSPSGVYNQKHQRLWDNIDPELDFTLEFGDGSVHFLALREENFTHCTLELIMSNGRLRYDEAGHIITWQSIVDDPVYGGYRSLDRRLIRIKSGLNCATWHAVDQLSHHLEGRPAYLCSGDDALKTLKIVSKIVGDSKTNE